jgi:adhesin/invasin
MTVPKPKTIQVTAYPAAVPADGRSISTITATVLDDGGEPLPSAQVTFTVDKPAIAVFQDTHGSSSGPRPTNTNGKATAVLVSAAVNAIDRVTVKATATKDSVQIEGQAQVSFTAQPSITVSVNPAQIPAAGVASTATITATVKDNTATPLANQRVGFGFDPDGASTSNTGASVAPATATTNAAGLAFCVLTSPPSLNNGSSDAIRSWIDSDADGKFDSTEVSALATITYMEPAASVAVTADPMSLPADGEAVAKISADVRTAVPNPVGPGMKPVADGTAVSFSVARVGDNKAPGTFTDTGTAATTAYTTNGIANAFLRASEATGAVRVAATAGNVSGTVQISYVAPAAQILELRASPQGIPADNTSTSAITAILRTAGGSPVSGAIVSFRTDLGTVSPITAATDGTGRATATLRAGTTAGVATVTATAGALIATVQVRFTSGEPAQIFFTVSVPSNSLPATNGLPSPSGVSPTAQVTARVVDRFGNPVLDGTNVFFKTDIGQITAAATTQNGVAQGTLVSCDFATATNMATFAPGIASIEASAVSPQGPPRAGPLHVIFSGDTDTRNVVTGGQTGTDLYTAYGASYLLSRDGGIGSEPTLSPVAGNLIRVSAVLRDGNDNPLPAAVPVDFTITYGDQQVTGTSNTGWLSIGGKIQSVASFDWTPTVLNSNPPLTKVYATISAWPQAAIMWRLSYGIGHWVGAAGPSSCSAQRAVPDSPWAALVTGDFSGTVEFDFRDQYGNAVQNGTNIYLSARDLSNVPRLEIVTNPARTTNGTARSAILGRLSADPANPGQFLAGSFTIVARFGNIEATIGVSVNPPPPP